MKCQRCGFDGNDVVKSEFSIGSFYRCAMLCTLCRERMESVWREGMDPDWLSDMAKPVDEEVTQPRWRAPGFD